MSEQTLHAILRLGEFPEILAAWPDAETAGKLAAELGEGHIVAPVRVAQAGVGFVAHVWACRASVQGGSWQLSAPAKLRGASRVVFDTADMPGERVHVDTDAGELERAVSGTDVHHLTAYASTPERAHELAEAKARELAAQ
ncbi:hypothetical protein [Amycolatopsis methanolica]|uniref:Uncharacterized protein n=1 Tax=Amycolatopsis methanolica 239 TaxID=1068978 RepID=A0A076N6A8_AMYME|nr:hypothetical protein [Amycolatopsis methanolica]AIJ26375.1 hypothetical protein AMETH_6283 [Amycolatopsis methanolica 239]AIJ26434.1 hypothetical protein AMETH_6342 [Amycolatopsis methanolica 239]